MESMLKRICDRNDERHVESTRECHFLDRQCVAEDCKQRPGGSQQHGPFSYGANHNAFDEQICSLLILHDKGLADIRSISLRSGEHFRRFQLPL
jgi:hypothetical protein